MTDTITTTKSNTEIILLAFDLFGADDAEQWQQQAQMYAQEQISDADQVLVDVIVHLMEGNPIWGGTVWADRAREIAREMSAPIIEVTVLGEEGWFRMGAPDLRG